MNLEEAGRELKIDLQPALTRFGNNEALYVRFLKKFAEDPTFDALRTAVEEKNHENAEKAAHTLKGVCANLGLEQLRNCSSQIVDAKRAGRLDEIEGLFAQCEKEYQRTRGVLENLG